MRCLQVAVSVRCLKVAVSAARTGRRGKGELKTTHVTHTGVESDEEEPGGEGGGRFPGL